MPTKAEYADLRARHVCVDCTYRPARPGEVRCAVCADASAKRAKEWRANNRDRSRTAALHRRESIYWSNPHVFRAEMTERRQAKKVDGVCIDCPLPCLDDNVRCEACKAKHAVRMRKYNIKSRKRKRSEAAREIREYRPIADVIDLTRVRILRAAKPLDWFTFDDLFDLLGGGDEKQRNTTAQMLGRMTKAGAFQRRRIAEGFSANGARWEYLIAEPGVAELDRVLRSARAPSTRAA